MAPWVVTKVGYDWWTGTQWLPAPHDFTVLLTDPAQALSLRAWFQIGNGDGAFTTGDLYLQYEDGTGWHDWPGNYGKNVEPGHAERNEDGELIVTIPQYVEFYAIVGDVYMPAGPYSSRVKVDWGGELHYSLEMGITTYVDAAFVSGDLDEFFRAQEFGVLAAMGNRADARTVLGVYDDPPTRTFLGVGAIEGQRPELLCEAALVGVIAEGEPLTMEEHPGRTFTIRGRKKSGQGMVTLQLEETT